MNALTEIAEVLSIKDEAITEAIHFLADKIKPCDMGVKEDHENECQTGSGHWYWCIKGKSGDMLRRWQEAFKAR